MHCYPLLPSDVARSEIFGGKQFHCLMSCDLEVTNESARCWGKNSSYITTTIIDTYDYLPGRDVFHEHVKEYKLAFSNDGSNFQVYQENGKEKV